MSLKTRDIPTIGLSIGLLGYLMHYFSYINLDKGFGGTEFPTLFVFVIILAGSLIFYLKNMNKEEKQIQYKPREGFTKEFLIPPENREIKEKPKDMFDDFK